MLLGMFGCNDAKNVFFKTVPNVSESSSPVPTLTAGQEPPAVCVCVCVPRRLLHVEEDADLPQCTAAPGSHGGRLTSASRGH